MRRALLPALAVAFVLLISVPPAAHAQVELCASSGFPAVHGSTACNGAARPVTVTANVKTYARLSLEEVFGAPATALQVAMGDVDANCVSAPAPGMTCATDTAQGAATWYGDIRLRVKLAGIGATRAKLTGLRSASGTMPTGRLLDGAAGTRPSTVYPVAPATVAELVGGIAAGDTIVTRSLGVRVVGSDASGAWASPTVYSLVLE
jgi:hypothetical protein